MKRSVQRNGAEGAFTLIELLVVIAIIGLLAGMVSFNVMKGLKKARQTRARGDIAQIGNACDHFKIDMGYYPNSLEDLINPPAGSGTRGSRWDGPYIKDGKMPVDPWGNFYDYRLDSHGYTIISYGADGQEGGVDEAQDISNLDEELETQ